MLYGNLLAEMARRGIKSAQLARALGVNPASAHAKLHGKIKRGWTPPEKAAVCELLGMERTEEVLEYLFTPTEVPA